MSTIQAFGRHEPGPPESPDASDRQEDAPLLSVVRGLPTEEELAALTAVVLSLDASDAEDEAAARRRSPLSRRELMSPHLYHGPGAWRRSSR